MSKSQAPPRNRLLAALPPVEFDRILPSLEVISFKIRAQLHVQGNPLDHVYFPNGGFASIVTVLQDGSMVEVATIGREGAVGVTAVIDNQPVPFASMVQGEADSCHRMTADAFHGEMDRRGMFCQLITRYSQALAGFVMQSTACNAVHNVDQRLARWLLMAHDRMEADEFPMTQEFMAMMLGVARPTVTIVAGTLQKAGLITYHRGHLAIVDREKLESASCECYRNTVRLLDAVLDGASR